MNLRKHKIFWTWGIIMAMMLPLGLDAAHFLIFHHYHIEPKTAAISYNQAEGHNVCHYNFATEIVNNQEIKINNNLSYYTFFQELKLESIKNNRFLFTLLRAPPTENQF